MVKRKEPSAPSFPGIVQLQPAIHGSSDANAKGPFVAYFASGYHPGLGDSLNFQVHRNAERPREHRLVMQKDNIDFVGSTVDAQGPPSCRYAVGLLDKRSGVIKYAEIYGGNVVRMEPRARGTNYGPTGHKTELEATAQARRAQNERLVHAFGSTRRQRQLKEKDLAQVVGENIEASGAVKEILGAAGEKAAQANATKDEIIKAVTGVRNIPLHHVEAMTASEAYRLNELVPPGAWDALDVSTLERAIADLGYRDDELRAEHKVPEYVLDRLAIITKPQSQTGARRLKALAFLAALINLYTGRHQQRMRAGEGMQSLASRIKIQADVLQPLLEQFYNMEETDEGNRIYSRTKEQHRSMLLYLLMTALIAEDYNLGGRQFESLRATLKLTPQELVTSYREMGCSTDRATDPASPLKQYRVQLLPEGLPGMPAKTLGEAFPALAVPRARNR